MIQPTFVWVNWHLNMFLLLFKYLLIAAFGIYRWSNLQIFLWLLFFSFPRPDPTSHTVSKELLTFIFVTAHHWGECLAKEVSFYPRLLYLPGVEVLLSKALNLPRPRSNNRVVSFRWKKNNSDGEVRFIYVAHWKQQGLSQSAWQSGERKER